MTKRTTVVWLLATTLGCGPQAADQHGALTPIGASREDSLVTGLQANDELVDRSKLSHAEDPQPAASAWLQDYVKPSRGISTLPVLTSTPMSGELQRGRLLSTITTSVWNPTVTGRGQDPLEWNRLGFLGTLAASNDTREHAIARQVANTVRFRPISDWGKLIHVYKPRYSQRPFDPNARPDTGISVIDNKPVLPMVPRYIDGELRAVTFDTQYLPIPESEFFALFQSALRVRLASTDSEMKLVKSSQLFSLSAITDKKQSRYQQYYRGLPVVGTGFSLLTQNGDVTLASGRVVADLVVADPARGVISEDTAIQTAYQALGGATLGVGRLPAASTIDGYRAISTLNHSMKTADALHVWVLEFPKARVEVDAVANVVRNISSKVHAVASSGRGVFNQGNNPADPKRVNFQSAKNSDNKYVLEHEKTASPAVEIVTYDRRANQTQQPGLALAPFTDSDNNNSFDDPDDAMGVSAHYNATKTFEFLAKNFTTAAGTPWLGTDGAGVRDISVIVHDSCSENGAYYSNDSVNFRHACPGQADLIPTMTIDVVAHELGHGVFDATVAGHSYSGETGALNEGIADVIAVLTRRDLLGLQGEEGWVFGIDNVPLGHRSLSNPMAKAMPEFYKGQYWQAATTCSQANDWCGVHNNSSVLSHWFYLLARGGKGVIGIGEKYASQVLFATLRYGLISPVANYHSMRLATDIAIQQLRSEGGVLPPTEVANILTQTLAAWAVVGVGERMRTYSPPSGSIDVAAWPSKLEWSLLEGETRWRLQVAHDAGFEQLIKDEPVTTFTLGNSPSDNRAYLSVNLPPNSQVFWRVRPVDNTEATTGALPPTLKWSDVQVLTTRDYNPRLLNPATGVNGDLHDPWGTTFKWRKEENVPAISSYKIAIRQVSFDSAGACTSGPVIHSAVVANNVGADPVGKEYTYDFALKESGTFDWLIQPLGPQNAVGFPRECSVAFDTRPAKSEAVLPAGPNQLAQLQHPLAGQGPTISLQWKPVANATKYKLRLASDDKMTKLIAIPGGDETYGEAAVSKTISLAVGTTGTFFWTVTPVGPASVGAEEGTASETSAFNVPEGSAIQLLTPANNASGIKSFDLFKWQTPYPGAFWSVNLQQTPFTSPKAGDVLPSDIQCGGTCANEGFTYPNNISDNKDYYWQVCALNAQKQVQRCSEVRQFKSRQIDYAAPVGLANVIETKTTESATVVEGAPPVSCTNNYEVTKRHLAVTYSHASPWGTRVEIIDAQGVSVFAKDMSNTVVEHTLRDQDAGTNMTIRIRSICSWPDNKPCSQVQTTTVAIPFQIQAKALKSTTCPNAPAPGTQCGVPVAYSGGNTPAYHDINLGKSSGSFTFMANLLFVPDEIQVRCRDGGTVSGLPMTSTGCTSWGDQWNSVVMGFACNSPYIRVNVLPNCAGNAPETAWHFLASCAD